MASLKEMGKSRGRGEGRGMIREYDSGRKGGDITVSSYDVGGSGDGNRED